MAELDAKIYAASTDDEDNASNLASNLSFPVAHGITRADADSVDAWWEERRGIIQPSEFILTGNEGEVVSATYSTGPVGRLDATDVVKYLNHRESR